MFRIGRKHASHVYPQSKGAPPTPSAALARNYAFGPAQDTALASTGTQVPWQLIEAGGSGTDIPITPTTSGRIRVSAMLTVVNNAEGWVELSVQAMLDGTPFATPLTTPQIAPAARKTTIPFLIEFNVPIGVTSQIELLLTPAIDDAISLLEDESSIEVQELTTTAG